MTNGLAPVGPAARADAAMDDIHAEVDRYYTAKVRRHGATPLGVDWTCLPTQELRFVQLLRLCDVGAPFSLNDLGCGYGALLAFMAKRHDLAAVDYLGIDLSAAMIRRARALWRGQAGAGFVRAAASPRAADYSVASGIFNVRQNAPLPLWERYVAATLTQMHATSRLGFAVNFMAPPAPGRAAREGVYQPDREAWARWCERELGCAVELREGYGLREVCLLVRRRGQAVG